MEREALLTLLIKIRRDSGKSLERFGADIGRTKQAIQQTESGESFPKRETLEAWLAVAGLHLITVHVGSDVYYLVRDGSVEPCTIAALDEATAPLDRSEFELVLRLARALPRVRGRSTLTPLLEQLLCVFEADES